MSLLLRYEAVQHSLSSIGSNSPRYGALSLAMSGQIGEAMISENTWDDSDGSLDIKGYREFWATETSAPSNNQVVYVGFVLGRTYHREGSFRTAAARRITVETSDGNTALGWRILFDGSGSNSANRPAETAGDRIRWLVNSSGRLPSLYAHPTYFANPTNAMDACDYRGQRYNDVLADIANTTGYNFFVQYSEGRARSELIFQAPSDTSYASTLSISNSLADVNANQSTTGTVFAPEDAELHRDPSRLAGGVYIAYDGGAIYQTRQSIYDEFALVDQAAPLANVKSSTKARAIATRYQDDNDEEDDRISCSIVVPASQVNDVRQGQVINAKFTHLPGYSSYVVMRVLKRTVIQDEAVGQSAYRIALELSPIGDVTPAATSRVVGAFFQRNVSTVTLPSGWTQLAQIAVTDGSATLAWGPASGSQSISFLDGNLTLFNELAVAELANVTSAGIGTAATVDDGTFTTTASITVNATGAGIILAAIRIFNFDSGARTLTKPAGFTSLYERMNASGAGDRDWGAVSFGYTTVSAAGNYTLTWTMSNQFNWQKVMAGIYIPNVGTVSSLQTATSGMVSTQTATATLPNPL